MPAAPTLGSACPAGEGTWREVGPAVQPLPHSQQGPGAENPIPVWKTSLLSVAVPTRIPSSSLFACKQPNAHRHPERPAPRAQGRRQVWALPWPTRCPMPWPLFHGEKRKKRKKNSTFKASLNVNIKLYCFLMLLKTEAKKSGLIPGCSDPRRGSAPPAHSVGALRCSPASLGRKVDPIDHQTRPATLNRLSQ